MNDIWRNGISIVTIELIILVCFAFSVRCSAAEGFRWIDANKYRLIVSVTPGRFQWKTTPVSVDMDLQEIEKKLGFPAAKIDLNSIRVGAYDAQGQVLLCDSKKTGRDRFYIPYRICENDFPVRLTVSWRMNIQSVHRFAIFFSEKGKSDFKTMSEMPVVGDGDFLPFGQRGILGPISGGYNEMVAAADTDRDGDMDLFVAYSGIIEKGGIYYFENTGKGGRPWFGSGHRIHPIKEKFQPIDWNEDGQIELLIKNHVYKLIRKDDGYELKDFMSLPKHGRADGIYIDWDGDGLRDLLTVSRLSRDYYPSEAIWDRRHSPFSSLGVWLGENLRGGIVFHKNIGSVKKPAFSEAAAVRVNEEPIELYGDVSISGGDWDEDGDVDLMAGNSFELLYFENVGREGKVKLAQAVSLKTAEDKSPFSIYVRPYLADMDSDGDLDILLGNEDGRPTWIEQLAGGKLSKERFLLQRDAVLDAGCLSVPVSCDWDGDGDIDLLVGNSSGFVEYFKNISDRPDEFSYVLGRRLRENDKEIRVLAGTAGSIQGPDEAKYGYTMPEVVDWDEDGDLDLLLSDVRGEHYFYENIGSRKNPRLTMGKPLLVDWPSKAPKPEWLWRQPGRAELVTHWRCRPATVDWNEDGFTDYVTVDHDGYLAYYEAFLKNGEKWLKPGQRIFRNEKGAPIRISEHAGGHSGRARIIIVDWDKDGDLDIIHNAHHLFGSAPALLKKVKNAGWYENLGYEEKAVFTWRGELIKKQIPISSEHSTTPEVVDFDGDGRLDLFLGGEDGRIECYHRAFIEDDLPILKVLRAEKRGR
ncbi:MAG: VCBS repeat-containing protein [Planctomycetes bacterium]|nr:VCBS repeat-containing protein [Planctomycetota bacterium]